MFFSNAMQWCSVPESSGDTFSLTQKIIFISIRKSLHLRKFLKLIKTQIHYNQKHTKDMKIFKTQPLNLAKLFPNRVRNETSLETSFGLCHCNVTQNI